VIIGIDLDGVIAQIDLPILRLADLALDKNEQEHVYGYYFAYRPIDFNSNIIANYPGDKIIIVTSRPEKFRELTEEWLEARGIRYDKLIFVDHTLPGDSTELDDWFRKMGELKAKVFEEEGIEIYLEDTPDAVKVLRELCPNVKIVQYGYRNLKSK